MPNPITELLKRMAGLGCDPWAQSRAVAELAAMLLSE